MSVTTGSFLEDCLSQFPHNPKSRIIIAYYLFSMLNINIKDLICPKNLISLHCKIQVSWMDWKYFALRRLTPEPSPHKTLIFRVYESANDFHMQIKPSMFALNLEESHIKKKFDLQTILTLFYKIDQITIQTFRHSGSWFWLFDILKFNLIIILLQWNAETGNSNVLRICPWRKVM